MKKVFLAVTLAASIGTAPVLILLILWDFIFVRSNIMPLVQATRVAFISAPFLFPLVAIGTAISCRRSVVIRMRPLAVSLGILGSGITGLISIYWCYILTHGFMG